MSKVTYNLERLGKSVKDLLDKAERLPDRDELTAELSDAVDEAKEYTDDKIKLTVATDTMGVGLWNKGDLDSGARLYELKEDMLTPIVITEAYNAQTAIKDGDGNVIADTYAKKGEGGGGKEDKEIFLFEGTISGYQTYTFTTDTTYETILEEYNKGKIILCKASISEHHHTIIPLNVIYPYIEVTQICFDGIGYFEVPENGYYRITLRYDSTWTCAFIGEYESQNNKLATSWYVEKPDKDDLKKYPAILTMTTYVESEAIVKTENPLNTQLKADRRVSYDASTGLLSFKYSDDNGNSEKDIIVSSAAIAYMADNATASGKGVNIDDKFAELDTLAKKTEMYGTADIEITPADCFTYIGNGDEVAITGFAASATAEQQKNIVIPYEINGKAVTTLDANCFAGNSNFESVVMPNSIKTIGENAFSFCDNLAEIVLSKNLTYIAGSAFASCSKLCKGKTIVIPEKVEYIGAYAFMNVNCSYMKFENTTTEITIDTNGGDDSFWSSHLCLIKSHSYIEKYLMENYPSFTTHYIEGEIPDYKIIYNPTTGDVGAYSLNTSGESFEVSTGFIYHTMVGGATTLNVAIVADNPLKYVTDMPFARMQVQFEEVGLVSGWYGYLYYNKYHYEITIDDSGIISARRFEVLENDTVSDYVNNFKFSYNPVAGNIGFSATSLQGSKQGETVNLSVNQATHAYDADNATNAGRAKYAVWADYYSEYGAQSSQTIGEKFDEKSDKTTFATKTLDDYGYAYVTLTDNTYTTITGISAYAPDTQEIPLITLTLPTEDIPNGYISGVTFTTGDKSATLAVSTDILFNGIDCMDNSFVPQANKQYEVIISRVGDELWGDVDARSIEVTADEE